MGMFDARSQKEAALAGSRLNEVAEGSRSFIARAANVEQADREVEATIARRDEELENIKAALSSQVEALKKEVSGVKNEIFSLKHNIKVTINILKTAARQRELEQLNMRVKRLSPFRKATREQAEKIVEDALAEGK